MKVTRTRLKICCIASIHEANMAIRAGADAIGLVGHMPSGPGVITDTQIREIAASVPPPIATFLLTSETDPDSVVDHVLKTGVNTVQLVDDAISSDVYDALRSGAPAVRIVQVIHVVGPASIESSLNVAQHVDALLLDSGNPDASVRELGGTGRVHDWSVSRAIVEKSPCPVFLAGGLTSDNVAAAVRAVQPFGVDLCSGVRTGDVLDESKLMPFVRALRASK